MIRSETCFTIACDADPECDPWEEGPWHFRSAEAAIEWAASNEWTGAGETTVCPEHTRRAHCAAVGHRWDRWWDSTLEDEVPYRRRDCKHCDHTEYDPPFREVSLLAHAAREMKRGDR